LVIGGEFLTKLQEGDLSIVFEKSELLDNGLEVEQVLLLLSVLARGFLGAGYKTISWRGGGGG